jgi:hypothetical protein
MHFFYDLMMNFTFFKRWDKPKAFNLIGDTQFAPNQKGCPRGQPF